MLLNPSNEAVKSIKMTLLNPHDVITRTFMAKMRIKIMSMHFPLISNASFKKKRVLTVSALKGVEILMWHNTLIWLILQVSVLTRLCRHAILAIVFLHVHCVILIMVCSFVICISLLLYTTVRLFR